jgi:diguanylate cyclase (GGDEF)-like protein
MTNGRLSAILFLAGCALLLLEIATATPLIAPFAMVLFVAAFTGIRQELLTARGGWRKREAENAALRGDVARLEQRSHDITLLAEMSEVLQLCTTLDEAIDVLPAYGIRLFPGFDGVVYIANATDIRSLESAAAWGSDLEDAPSLNRADCWGLRRGDLHVAQASEAAIRCRHARDERAMRVCLPLFAAGETAGLLTLHAPEDTHVPANAELFADQVALALANLRMQEALRTRALRDGLTGLYNRRHMEEALGRQLAHDEASTGVLIIDVDHFKRFNDTWGHGAGDTLLQQLARAMQLVFGEHDLVCRYGGEEFVVVMPHAGGDLVRARAERLREGVKRLNVHHDGQLLGSITLSMGVAVSPDHGTTVETLIANADRALYAAKTAGRDRVATPPPQMVSRDAA